MVARIRIGSLFGSKGIFVSKPGKDVTVAGSQLLMDTRYEYLQVHAVGRFDIDYYQNFPIGGEQHDTGNFYRGSTTFPALGYIPMYYVSLALKGAWIGSADNNSWYPCMTGAYEPNYGRSMPGNSNYGDVLQYGYKVGDGTIDVGLSVIWNTLEQQWDSPMKVDYIIFKNPAV